MISPTDASFAPIFQPIENIAIAQVPDRWQCEIVKKSDALNLSEFSTRLDSHAAGNRPTIIKRIRDGHLPWRQLQASEWLAGDCASQANNKNKNKK